MTDLNRKRDMDKNSEHIASLEAVLLDFVRDEELLTFLTNKYAYQKRHVELVERFKLCHELLSRNLWYKAYQARHVKVVIPQ
jgi:hypothetical protein